MEILVGADPEVFVRDHNKFLSAHNLIPGDKKNPYKVPHGAVQVDGMALEFNIDPAHSCEEFLGNIRSVYEQLQAMVPTYNLAIEPVAMFDEEYFASCPAESKILGCDPDFNAWTSLANQPPDNKMPMRTAAGHIHIGWTNVGDPFDKNHFDDCTEVTKQLDYYLGIYSLKWDSNNLRRSMYGKAGAFRPKSYGSEYRVLSNAWLKDDELVKWVYNTSVKAVSELADGNSMFDKYGDLARHIIDNNIVDWQNSDDFKHLHIQENPVVLAA